MLKHWKWLLLRSLNNLSVKAGLYAIAAVAAALIAVKFAPYISDDVAELLGGDAANSLLTILASSMLVVVTFSMSTLLASYSIAAGVAPSRATSFVIRNEGAQSALSTFLGAFIFSIVALVALSTKYYGPKGRSILFLMTIAVLTFVILKIIQWIGQLAVLGHLNQVQNQIENTTIRAIHSQPRYFRWDMPEILKSATHSECINSSETGYVQRIDFKVLHELGKSCRLRIDVHARVGEFMSEDSALAKVSSDFPQDQRKNVADCFLIGKNRTFEEDPRFGIIMLSEIASRALSPGINDPGTAIEIIGTLVRVLQVARKVESPTPADDSDESFLAVKRISAEELFDDAFRAIARDGAGMLEVIVFLQKALQQLVKYTEFESAALHLSEDSVTRSLAVLKNRTDIERIQKAAEKVRS